MLQPAVAVLLGGVSAALHVGKLPPAIPLLGDQLGVSLVQAGFLLSLVQLAGMSLGLLAGLLADGWGLRRTMLCGLLLLGGASLVGACADSAPLLMLTRALEGVGLLMAAMPAPGLIRRHVPPERMGVMLGLWGTYMPLGSALALLLGPGVMALAGWSGWWSLLGLCTLGMAWMVGRAVPPDAQTGGVDVVAPAGAWLARLRATLASRGPWLVAACFAMYSGQWLAVIGFLPSIHAQAGIAGTLSAVLSAAAAAANILGNALSGRLLQSGWTPTRSLCSGFASMALGATLAFAPLQQDASIRYAGVLLFSAVGGLIPGTLFSLSVRLAPSPHAVSTTVGLMQQMSSLGQFAGPPLVAAVAAAAGGWQWTWVVTGAAALAGAGFAALIAQVMAAKRGSSHR